MSSGPTGTDASWQQINALLEAALEQEPEQREAFLRQACGDDRALLQRVLGLLHDGTRSDSFLVAGSASSTPAEGWAQDAELKCEVRNVLAARCAETAAGVKSPAAMLGRSCGPYRIEAHIGDGGMGSVYKARRSDGVYDQPVAVKITKGIDSDALVRRFEKERRILAALRHPNIARLLDGGTSPEGWPYLVMEYVEGDPLTTYCEARKLSLADRLQLFRSVCSAVHFAHQSLIIHRDLKPANILVDRQGVPRLLDFGIAKLLADDPHQTHTELRPMTPAYASPEQLRGETMSTATDIYSLGVVLYELLAGCRPFPTRSRPPLGEEATDLIPEPPSLAVRRRARGLDGTTGRADRRRSRLLAGDLDNVVLMALRPDPARRYGSVQELAEDLRRHGEGLPVSARGDALSYRATKFVRRHLGAVAAAGVVALLVAGSITNMALQRHRIAGEQETAEQVARLLIEVFELSDPQAGVDEDITLREVLDRGAARVLAEVDQKPQVAAELMATLGTVYANLGLYERAEPLLEQAVAIRREREAGDPKLAETLRQMAELRRLQGRSGEADRLGAEAAAIRD